MNFVATILALALGASSTAAQAPDGAALYQQHCRMCHGAKGVPPQRMVTLYPGLKMLADSGLMATLSTDSIAAVVRHGAGRYMMAFGEKLSAAEVAAVAKFVKTLAGGAPRAP